MKLTKLSLIEETKEFYIFSVSFKSFAGTAFFGEKTKKAFKSKKGSLSYWMDSGDWVNNDGAIDVWLTTDKKDFKI